MYYRPIFSFTDNEVTPRTINVSQFKDNPYYEMTQYRFYHQALQARRLPQLKLLYRIIVRPKEK